VLQRAMVSPAWQRLFLRLQEARVFHGVSWCFMCVSWCFMVFHVCFIVFHVCLSLLQLKACRR